MSSFDPRPDLVPPEPHRRRRSPSRFLAPLALIAVIVGLVLIISHANVTSTTTSTTDPFAAQPGSAHTVTSLRPHNGRSSTTGGAGLTGTVTTGTTGDTNTLTTATAATTGTTGTTTTGTTTVGTYTIAAGDTFAAVSAKTGVPLATIEKLNPGVSSSALTVGQVIKLK